MKDTDYAFSVAKIRANENRLLTGAQVNSLVDESSFERVAASLHSLGWLENEKDVDISKAVKAQNKMLWNILRESVPNKEELKVLTILNDFFNVKAALKCMLTEQDPEKLYTEPTSLDLEKLTESIKAHSFERLEGTLGECAKEAYEAACRTESGQSADIIIDSAALSFLLNEAKNSKSELLTEIFEFICDSTNMKIAFRCAKTNKDISFCEAAIAPCARLDRKKLCESTVKGEKELYAYLETTAYSKGAALLSKSTTAFEKWCDDTVTEISKKAKYIFFGFEPIAAYYFAKTAEIKTVRVILSGKKSGVPAEIIKERVRALYV